MALIPKVDPWGDPGVQDNMPIAAVSAQKDPLGDPGGSVDLLGDPGISDQPDNRKQRFAEITAQNPEATGAERTEIFKAENEQGARQQLPTVTDLGKGLLSGFAGGLADTGQMMQQGRRLASPLFLAGKAAQYIGEKVSNPETVQAGQQMESMAGTAPQIIQDKLSQAAEKSGLFNTAAAIQTAGDLISGKAFVKSGEEASQSLMDSMTPGGRAPSTMLGQVLTGTAQSAPSTLMAVIPTMAGTKVLGLMRIAPKVATLLQKARASAKVAKAVGELSEVAIPASGVEGAQAGFQNARQTQRQIEEMPFEKLTDHPEFQKALSATDSTLPETERLNQARQQVAKQAGDYILALTAPSTGGIGLLTGGAVLGRIASKGKTGLITAIRKSVGKTAEEESIQQAVSQGVGRRIAKSIGQKARGAIEGGIEEMAQETPQSGVEQIIQNLGVKRYADQKQSITEGAGQSALVGGLSGGLLGAIGGGAAAFGAGPEVTGQRIVQPVSVNPESPAPTAQTVGPAPAIDQANFEQGRDKASSYLREKALTTQNPEDAAFLNNAADTMDAAETMEQYEPVYNSVVEYFKTPEQRYGLASVAPKQAVETQKQNLVNVLAQAVMTRAQAPGQSAIDAARGDRTADDINKAKLESILTVPPTSTQPQITPSGDLQSESGAGPNLPQQQQEVTQNANIQGQQSVGNQQQYPGIEAGAAVPANTQEVQQKEGAEAGGGNRVVGGAEVQGAVGAGERVGVLPVPVSARAEPEKYRVSKDKVTAEVQKRRSDLQYRINMVHNGMAAARENQNMRQEVKSAFLAKQKDEIANLEQQKAAVTPAAVEADMFSELSAKMRKAARVKDARQKKIAGLVGEYSLRERIHDRKIAIRGSWSKEEWAFTAGDSYIRDDKNGVEPDEVAADLGFENTEALKEALKKAPTQSELLIKSKEEQSYADFMQGEYDKWNVNQKELSKTGDNIPIGEINKGDRFKVKGEEFTVDETDRGLLFKGYNGYEFEMAYTDITGNETISADKGSHKGIEVVTPDEAVKKPVTKEQDLIPDEEIPLSLVQDEAALKADAKRESEKARGAEERKQKKLDEMAIELPGVAGEKAPEFLTEFWKQFPDNGVEFGTAFTPERLKLAGVTREEAIKIINDARVRGVSEDFIIDRSKYTATDIALKDIRDEKKSKLPPKRSASVEPVIVAKRTVYANLVYVDQNEIDSGRQALRLYDKNGDRKKGVIVRQNIIGFHKEGRDERISADIYKNVDAAAREIQVLQDYGFTFPASQPRETESQGMISLRWKQGWRPYRLDENGLIVKAYKEDGGKRTLMMPHGVWVKPPSGYEEKTKAVVEPVSIELSPEDAVSQGKPVKLPLGTLKVRADYADGKTATVNAGDIETLAVVGKIVKLTPLQGKDKLVPGEITVKVAKLPPKVNDRPEVGKQYSLSEISKGKTWAQSDVTQEEALRDRWLKMGRTIARFGLTQGDMADAVVVRDLWREFEAEKSPETLKKIENALNNIERPDRLQPVVKLKGLTDDGEAFNDKPATKKPTKALLKPFRHPDGGIGIEVTPVIERPRTEVKSAISNLSAEKQARAKELQDKLRKMTMGRVSMGFDPEILTTSAELAKLYVEGGAKTFKQFATNVKADMGDAWDRVKAYLHSAWQAAGVDDTTLDDVSRADAAKIIEDMDKRAVMPEPVSKRKSIAEKKSVMPVPKSAEEQIAPTGEPGAGQPMEVVKQFHTKRGKDVFIVTLGSRVDADTFKRMAAQARMLGGKWSREWKPTRSPAGFMFNKSDSAEAFMNGYAEQTAPAKLSPSQSDIAREFQNGGRGAVLPDQDVAEIRDIILSDESQLQKTIRIKKLAGTIEALKDVQERVEVQLVNIARDIVKTGGSVEDVFDKLRDLYQHQPNLSARTSSSIEKQQYSTPAPLAYLLGYAMKMGEAAKVYDPTGGNGMLFIGAGIGSRITANELDVRRQAGLKVALAGDYVTVTGNDAMKESAGPAAKSQDAVIANPPFFSTDVVNYEGYKITRAEHLIALRALESMKDDGVAGLILAANREEGKVGSGADTTFLNYVYGHYNVVDMFDVSGDLYARQGAALPVRVVVIAGRRANSEIADLAPKKLDFLTNWDSILSRTKEIRHEVEIRGVVLGAGNTSADVVHPEQRSEAADEVAGVSVAPVEVAGKTGRSDTGGRGRARSDADTGSRRGTPLDNTGKDGLLDGLLPFNRPASTGEPDVQGPAGQRQPIGVEAGRERGAVGQPAIARDEPREPEVRSGELESGGVREFANVKQLPVFPKKNDSQSVNYPMSDSESMDTLVPSGMAQGIRESLNRLVKKVGNIDDYVAGKLETTKEALYKGLGAEQIDGVALAIDQIENGEAIIIGDETGIGKGRQIAALIEYARRNGKTPIFFTKDAKLFSDMYGDGKAIGAVFKPLLIGSKKEGEIRSGLGTLFVKVPEGAARARIFRSVIEKGLAASGYNCVFVAYSQLNKKGLQQQLITHLAQNENTLMLMDEAHSAAGDQDTSMTAAFFSGGEIKRGTGAQRTTTILPGVLNMAGVQRGRGGVAYFSATFAKRPDNMGAYFRTILGRAAHSMSELIDTMRDGGVAMQQAVSEALAQAGQMIRRERDFSGVPYVMKEVGKEHQDAYKVQADTITEQLESIVNFSALMVDSIRRSNLNRTRSTAQSQNALAMTGFASRVHNQISQMLLAMKVDDVVAEAVESVKRGEKPLITFHNTMEGFLSDYAEENNIKDGDEMELSWRSLLLNALEGTVYASETDAQGNKSRIRIDPATIGLGRQYNELKNTLKSMNIDMYASPIDGIRVGLDRAGISHGEITGRKERIDYQDGSKTKGVYHVFVRERKGNLVDSFNTDETQALLFNGSGSTGVSLHASKQFTANPKPRHMFIVQPNPNISDFVQTLGRIRRTGMIVGGAMYTHLVLPLQAEIRPGVMALKKMKSLNANTKSEGGSGINLEFEDMVNKFGDQVMAEYLYNNRDIAQRLGADVISFNNDTGKYDHEDDITQKMTGHMAYLPDSVQEAIYNDVIAQYRDLIEQVKTTGEYDLEIVVHEDWNAAKGKTDQLSHDTDENNMLTSGVAAEEWNIRDTRHVPTGAEMQETIKRRWGADPLSKAREEMKVFDAKAKEAVKWWREHAKVGPREQAIADHVIDGWGNTRPMILRMVEMVGSVVEFNGVPGTITKITYPREVAGRVSMAAGGFRFEAMINDSTGKAYVTGAKIIKGEGPVASDKSFEDMNKVEQNRRVDRTVLTGNPFEAHRLAGNAGQMVRFKTEKEGVVTGRLMPINWNRGNLLVDPVHELASAAAAVRFVKLLPVPSVGQGQKVLTTAQGTVKVFIATSHNGGKEAIISVPASRRLGGEYFLNPEIREITGDWNKFRNRMSVRNISMNDLAKILPMIQKISNERFRAEENNLINKEERENLVASANKALSMSDQARKDASQGAIFGEISTREGDQNEKRGSTEDERRGIDRSGWAGDLRTDDQWDALRQQSRSEWQRGVDAKIRESTGGEAGTSEKTHWQGVTYSEETEGSEHFRKAYAVFGRVGFSVTPISRVAWGAAVEYETKTVYWGGMDNRNDADAYIRHELFHIQVHNGQNDATGLIALVNLDHPVVIALSKDTGMSGPDLAEEVSAAYVSGTMEFIETVFSSNAREIRDRIWNNQKEQGAAKFSLGGTEKGMSHASAIDAINAIAHITGDVRVIQSESEIPTPVLKQAQEKGYTGRIEGFEWQGKPYVVADNLKDARHAQARALHEAFHAGLDRAFTGEQRSKILNATLTNLGRKMELAAIARKYDLDLANEADHERAMNELIAKISQERTSKPKVWARFVGAIRQALRDMGLLTTMTDADIDYLIERALEVRGRLGGRRGSAFSLKEKLDKTRKRSRVTSDETKQAYDRARVDKISGQRSLLGERRVSRITVNRIAARSAELYNAWSNLAHETDESVSASSRNSVDQKVGVDARTDVNTAIERGILPEIDITRLGIRPETANDIVYPWENLQKSSKLKLISAETGEAVVFQSSDGKSVYKLIPPYVLKGSKYPTYLASYPRMMDTPSGGMIATGDLGTLGNLLERITVHHELGGIPTEIVGATKDGIVILKQPFAETALGKRMGRIGAIDRARLVEIPREIVDYYGDTPAYVATVNGEPYLVMDLRNENLGLDTMLRERLIDPNIGKMNTRFVADRPKLAEIVEQARAKEHKANFGKRITNWSLADKPFDAAQERLAQDSPNESISVLRDHVQAGRLAEDVYKAAQDVDKKARKMGVSVEFEYKDEDGIVRSNEPKYTEQLLAEGYSNEEIKRFAEAGLVYKVWGKHDPYLRGALYSWERVGRDTDVNVLHSERMGRIRDEQAQVEWKITLYRGATPNTVYHEFVHLSDKVAGNVATEQRAKDLSGRLQAGEDLSSEWSGLPGRQIGREGYFSGEPLPNEYVARLMQVLEEQTPLIDRAATTGYTFGKAEGKAEGKAHEQKVVGKLKMTLAERMEKMRSQVVAKRDRDLLAMAMHEKAKGRKEAEKIGKPIWIKRGMEIGRTESVEDSVKLSFLEIAKERGQHYQDTLFHADVALGTLDMRIKGIDKDGSTTTPLTPDQAESYRRWILKEFFGDERYMAIRRASRGDLNQTLSAVRDAMHKELAKHYVRALERLILVVKPTRMLPEYKTVWNQATEDLTPDTYTKKNWEEAKAKFEELSQIYTENRQEQNNRKRAQRAGYENDAAEMASELSGAVPEIKETNTTPSNRGFIRTALIDKMGNFLTRALTLAGGKINSLTVKTLFTDIKTGENKALNKIRDCVTDLNAVMERLGITEHKVVEMRSDLKPVTIGGKIYKMTDSERIDLAAGWKRPTSKMLISLNGWWFQRKKGQGGRLMGETVEETIDMVNDVLKTITPAEQEIADAMVRIVTAMGADGNKVSVIRDGWARFGEIVYWPQVVDRSTTQQTLDKGDGASPEQWARLHNQQTLNGIGFTKETQSHTHPLLVGDAFDKFYYHVNLMARYSHLNIPTYAAMRMFGDPRYGNELRKRVGTGFVSDYRYMLQRVSGLRGYVGEEIWKKGFDMFSRNAAVAILWYRPTSIIFNRMGGAFLATAVVKRILPNQATRFKLRVFMPVFLNTAHAKAIIEKFKKKNGFLWKRWSSDMSRVYAPLGHERYGELTRTKFGMYWRRMQEWGLRPMANAEMKTAIVVYDMAIRDGLSEEEAIDKVETVIRESQNPSSDLDESIWYTKIRDSGLGGFVPFLGQVVASHNMVVQSNLTLQGAKREGNKEKIKAARSALTSVVLALAANLALEMTVRAAFRAMMRKPPDDDDERAAEKALVNRIFETASNVLDILAPGAGRGLDYVKSAVMSISGVPADPSLFGSTIGKIFSGIKRISHPYVGADDDYDAAKLERGITDLIEGSGMLVGGPTGGPLVYYKIIRRLIGD